MDWCGREDESDLCVTSTISGCLALVFFVAHVVRLRDVARQFSTDETELRWLALYLFIIAAQTLLTMAEGIVRPLSAALLFQVLLSLLFYLSQGALTYAEAYRLVDWPWRGIPWTMLVVNTPEIVYALSALRSGGEDALTASYALWASKAALALLALALFLLRARCEGEDVTYTISLRERSQDFSASLPVHQREGKSSRTASAIDRVVYGELSDDRSRQSSRWTAWWSWTTKQSHEESGEGTQRLLSTCSDNDNEEEMRRLSQSFLQAPRFHTQSLSMSGSSGGNGSAGSSRALLQVMEQHRAKLNALNPVLEPRGGIDDYDEALMRKHSSIKRSSSSHAADALAAAAQSEYLDTLRFQVIVHKWGLRSKRNTAANNNVDADNGEGESEVAQAVTEFEIVVAARTSNDKNPVDWNRTSQQKVSVNRWTVWRSTEEIMKLHAQMVNVLGDMIPRRPRLNSSTTIASALSFAELVADMRVIAVYLNALLRSKEFVHKPLEDFLELERAKILLNMGDAKEALKTRELPAPPVKETATAEELSTARDQQAKETTAKPLLIKTNGEPSTSLSDDAPSAVSPSSAPSTSPPAAATAVSASAKIAAPPGSSAKVSTARRPSTMDSGDQIAARQEKWRKLFTRMKIKLKPRDICIRCRLFEGVLSGEEISAWLMRSATADNTGEVDEHAAIDRSEACAIGQELLDCDLLEIVCAGLIEDDTESGADSSSAVEPEFSDMPGYVYRFKGKSSSPVSVTLFGAPTSTSVPSMTTVEDGDIRGARDTMFLSIFDSAGANMDVEGGEGGTQSGNTHIQYIINISHGGDTWQITKRYREFENLHKALVKEGIRAEAQLPPKSFMSAMSRTKLKQTESRRIGLEQYIASVLQAVVEEGSEKGKIVLAKFLDDEFQDLRLVTRRTTTKQS